MLIEWVLLDNVLKLYLMYKSKNRDFHHISLQNALTRDLSQIDLVPRDKSFACLYIPRLVTSFLTYNFVDDSVNKNSAE